MTTNDVAWTRTRALLEVEHLAKHYPCRRISVAARRSARGRRRELQIEDGETLGLVGESGCGKSTLGKTVSAGRCDRGQHAGAASASSTSKPRHATVSRELQAVFQDPHVLNPRMRAADIVAEPMRNFEQVPDPQP